MALGIGVVVALMRTECRTLREYNTCRSNFSKLGRSYRSTKSQINLRSQIFSFTRAVIIGTS